MKTSKRDQTYAQRKSVEKKSDEKKKGSLKLDRKSSRGMIYENEELRLRTININAEVERGQSDIRKLRRENEQLRREIWSLRDEYDRLNKRFKANKYLPDSISEHGQSESNSEDSDSCDTCRDEVDINEKCLDEQHDCGRQRDSFPSLSARQLQQQQYERCLLEESSLVGDSFCEQKSSVTAPTPETSADANESNSAAKPRENLHVNFDHLSIVSEENLSNSDGNLTQPPSELNHQAHQQQQTHPSFYYDENFIEIDGSRLSPSQCLGAMSLPSLAPLRPITPIEMVANQLNDLQSMVPPLSYFENIVQQHMGTTINSMAGSNTSTNTGETVIQTNGWDYNIQSPFLQRKLQPSEPSSSNSTSTTMSPSHLYNNPPLIPAREETPQVADLSSTNDGAYKNLKHFFSPIKPRLKLDTALATKVAASCSIPQPPPPVQYLERLYTKCEPPDVYVTNALASPYYPQPITGLSLPSVLVPAQGSVPQSHIEPIYATAQKKPHSSEQSLATIAGSSKNSINLEQILNEIGSMSEDILQMQLEKSKSQEKLTTHTQLATTTTTSLSETSTPLHTASAHTHTLPPPLLCGQNNNLSKDPPQQQQQEHHQYQQQNMPSDKNRKPYRSEMNLLLSYNGTNPVIIPLAKNQTGGGISTSDGGVTDRDGNSPSPPQLPTPMAPFPNNLMYLGFDRLNQSLGDSGDLLYTGAKAALQFMPSPTLDTVTNRQHQHVITPSPAQPPPPPVPPAPTFPESDRLEDLSVLRMRDQNQESLNTVLAISSPDLSTPPLAAIAPLKRRIFSRQKDDGSSSQTTRSFDGADVNSIRSDAKQHQQQPDAASKGKLFIEGSSNEINSYESSSGSEATKRKSSRRVSIVCHEDKPAGDKCVLESSESQLQPFEEHQHQPSSASVEKLDNVMPSIIVNLKHAHSTPNSPHSNRRRGGNTNSAISVNSGSSTLHHHGHHHHHHHHHHSRKLSQESIAEARCASVANSIVNSSQDNVLGAASLASPSQHSTRYKCSRRHSEGTVSSMVGGGTVNTAGGGTRISSTGNHHHHHHHNQDSNQETGTSISERNSGSLASSRDSSTSLSMRSQRRKISVSSHTGGKIPWCGCWGQSDIRKLRRENEQLRREIWSLRDEYDRLNKRFKANKYLPDSISEHGQSESNSEDSDSCDTCRDEVDINEKCLDEQHDCGRQRDSFPSLSARQLQQQQYERCLLEESSLVGDSFCEQKSSVTAPTPETSADANESNSAAKPRENLHVNFDHLSIVSEENLSNSDGNLTQPPSELNHQAHQQQQTHPSFYYDENFIEIDGSRLSPSQCLGAMSLPSLAPLRPITPIEMVANQLNDLQSMVPPLSYFENIVQQHMGTTINSMAGSNTSTNTGETVIQTNGWDYNIQSPFLQRKLQPSEPSSSNSTSTTMSPSHLYNNPPLIPAREETPQVADLSSTNDGAYKNLKHFFSPIKPRLKLDTALATKVAASCSIPQPPPPVQYLERLYTKCEPPDVYVTNALASPYYPQPITGLSLPSVLVPAQGSVPQSHIEPIYATAQKKPHSSEQSLATIAGSSKNSINLEQILNEIGSMSEDILQMQLEKSKSQEKLTTHTQLATTTTTSLSETSTPLHTASAHTHTLPPPLLCGQNNNLSKDPPQQQQQEHHQYQQQNMPSDKNRKPYRSEMNLLLSYNGTNPVIIPLAKNQTGGGISTSDGGVTDRDGNSPSPPQLPTPMAPFPNNLMYLGFDRLNQSLGDSGDLLYTGAKAALQFMPSPTLDTVTNRQHQHVITPSPAQPPPPPVPPAPTFPESDRLEDLSVLRMRDQNQESLNTVLAISSPDLSTPPLAAIAPLKRRIFSRQKDDGSSSQTTRSFDGADVNSIRSDAKQHQQQPDAASKGKLFIEGSSNEINSYESSSGSEATKRKSSRRVSIVCHEDKPAGDKCVLESSESQLQPFEEHQHQPSSASVEKLDNVMPSIIVNLKHAHSTPNSPHSNRRRGGNTNSAISVNSGSSTLHHHGHHHHHHHHHHSRKLSQESIAEARCASVANSIVNSSQDNVLGAASLASPSQHSTRYKCSRRHSEGTVSSMVGGGTVNTAGGGTRISSTGNHHHHHHHNQDSNQETGTSISERNSGSLASSRDSSTSLSMRSQRRKISVSSHTGGKIPWCGCWGNGCL